MPPIVSTRATSKRRMRPASFLRCVAGHQALPGGEVTLALASVACEHLHAWLGAESGSMGEQMSTC